MKRSKLILHLSMVTALAVMAAFVLLSSISINTLSPKYFPEGKSDTLNHPLVVIGHDAAGLKCADGSTLPAPGFRDPTGTGDLIAAATMRGMEIALFRLCSSPVLKSNAVPMRHILAFRDALLSAPNVSRIAAGPHHEHIFRELVSAHHVTGNLVNDAWLAALAIKNHATLVSADENFRKFKGLRRLNPGVS